MDKTENDTLLGKTSTGSRNASKIKPPPCPNSCGVGESQEANVGAASMKSGSWCGRSSCLATEQLLSGRHTSAVTGLDLKRPKQLEAPPPQKGWGKGLSLLRPCK